RRYTGRSDYGNLTTNKISRQHWQSIKLILGPAVFDRHVLARDIASLLQALAERPQPFRDRIGRSGVQIPDHRHRRLLRACRERPSACRAADARDDVARRCRTRKEHTERWGGSVREPASAATGSPQPLWTLVRE